VTVIKRVLNRKISKFSALISLSALAAMFIFFFLFIPRFVTSTAGQLFVGVWALMAVLAFFAHGRRVTTREGRQYIPVYGVKKVERTAKARSTSSMGGL